VAEPGAVTRGLAHRGLAHWGLAHRGLAHRGLAHWGLAPRQVQVGGRMTCTPSTSTSWWSSTSRASITSPGRRAKSVRSSRAEPRRTRSGDLGDLFDADERNP